MTPQPHNRPCGYLTWGATLLALLILIASLLIGMATNANAEQIRQIREQEKQNREDITIQKVDIGRIDQRLQNIEKSLSRIESKLEAQGK